jgi:uncharacterized membrane-anchored protein
MKNKARQNIVCFAGLRMLYVRCERNGARQTAEEIAEMKKAS